MRGLIAAVVALLVAAGGGFAIGVALEHRGRVDPVAEPDPATVRDSRAFAFDCPGGAVVAAFGRADRVAVTGRDDDADWVEVRSPFDPAAVVWMSAAQVDVEGGLAGLPIRPCGDPVTTPPTIAANPADDRPLFPPTTPPQDPTTTTEPEATTTSTTDDTGASTSSSSTSSTSTTSSSTSTTTGVTLFPPPPTSTTTSTTTTTEPAGDEATG